MDGDVLSLSSSSSLSCLSATGTHRDTLPKSDSSLPHNQQAHPSTEELWTELECPVGDRLLSTEEQVTLITESMTVTSTDQEKLLLLNRNTELRRVNKELMKLNQDWDQVYRSATLGLQHRLEAVDLENTAIKQLNSRLLLKVEHQQSAKQYYEQALMHELKKNQELQEYITLLESRRHLPDKDCTPAPQDSFSAVIRGPVSYRTSHPPGLSPSPLSDYNPPSSSFFPAPSSQEAGRKGKGSGSSTTPLGDAQHEVKDLKEQLEALRCQTQIYEAEYETEHNDHKHTQQENRRLRKKREETRQQVALLQEQLKVYEDDFQRERSDKQMLQRLLLKKNPASSKDPVLIHRCNNEQQPLGGDKRTQTGDRRKQHHPFCPNHPHMDKESD